MPSTLSYNSMHASIIIHIHTCCCRDAILPNHACRHYLYACSYHNRKDKQTTTNNTHRDRYSYSKCPLPSCQLALHYPGGKDRIPTTNCLPSIWGAKCAKITFLMLSLLFRKYLSLLLCTVSLSSYLLIPI